MARAENVWLPGARPVYDLLGPQAVYGAPSRLHSKRSLGGGSGNESRLKSADVENVVALGLDVI
jgi:hypothetical protein